MRAWNAVVLTTICCVITSVAAPAQAAPAAAKLPPADIQKTFFTGQPFTSATPQNIKYTMTFTADGKVTREPLGKAGVKGAGTWKLDKERLLHHVEELQAELLRAGRPPATTSGR